MFYNVSSLVVIGKPETVAFVTTFSKRFPLHSLIRYSRVVLYEWDTDGQF